MAPPANDTEAAITFRQYLSADKELCLGLFDANCPEFFAPDERAEYAAFLDAAPDGYEVCLVKGGVAGAYGLIGHRPDRRSLNWILIAPRHQGMGIGSAIMRRVADRARAAHLGVVTIAASHKSAPFFSRFGAAIVARTEHGWGAGMHRVDMELSVLP